MSQLLLHIGYPKAGSTFLQQWFDKHPEIYFQPKYMAEGFYHAWQLADYIQHVEKVPENFVLSCEDFMLWQGRPYWYGLTGTEPYDYRTFQNKICETLYNIFPTAKVLMITRGYTTVFASIYAQYISMGGTLSCMELMKRNEEMFTTFLDYSYTINLYQKKFGKDNLVVLPYELLNENPEEFLSLIEAQLTIKSKFNFTFQKLNASMSEAELSAYHKTSRLLFSVLKPFSKSLQIKIYSAYCNAVRAQKPHPVMAFISKFVSGKVDMNACTQMAYAMKGKAEILRSEKYHQNYLLDYMIDK
jgi:hypothetical protein